MRPIKELTDADALKVAELISGWPVMSDESKIHQVKDLIATNKLYNNQTNIPGMKWYRIFKYLESAGYIIDKESQPSFDQIAGMRKDMDMALEREKGLIAALEKISKQMKVSEWDGTSMFPELIAECKERVQIARDALAPYNQSPSTGEQEEKVLWSDVSEEISEFSVDDRSMGELISGFKSKYKITRK